MQSEIIKEINELKTRRNAIILAHNYVPGEIQDIADFTGDSLELSIKAAQCGAPVIVFCGVRFMAETAKILSPKSTVLLPEPSAGCPMADMAEAAEVAAYRRNHPDTVLVAYVNTTAATKACVDICCTSANADKIVATIPPDKEIMFLPDRNLGKNITNGLRRPMEYWPGCCPIHDRVTVAMIDAARRAFPHAPVLVHPECREAVVAAADYALSTGGMLRMIRESAESRFIVATESGILHRMRKENPGKEFYALQPELCCENMKLITLEKVRDSLRLEQYKIELPAELMDKARASIEKMLAVK